MTKLLMIDMDLVERQIAKAEEDLATATAWMNRGRSGVPGTDPVAAAARDRAGAKVTALRELVAITEAEHAEHEAVLAHAVEQEAPPMSDAQKARKLVLHIEIDEFHGAVEEMWSTYREHVGYEAPLVDLLTDGVFFANPDQIVVAFQVEDGDCPIVQIATVGRLVDASLARRATSVQGALS